MHVLELLTFLWRACAELDNISISRDRQQTGWSLTGERC